MDGATYQYLADAVLAIHFGFVLFEDSLHVVPRHPSGWLGLDGAWMP